MNQNVYYEKNFFEQYMYKMYHFIDTWHTFYEN